VSSRESSGVQASARRRPLRVLNPENGQRQDPQTTDERFARHHDDEDHADNKRKTLERMRSIASQCNIMNRWRKVEFKLSIAHLRRAVLFYDAHVKRKRSGRILGPIIIRLLFFDQNKCGRKRRVICNSVLAMKNNYHYSALVSNSESRKIFKTAVTRYYSLTLKCIKFDFGSAVDLPQI